MEGTRISDGSPVFPSYPPPLENCITQIGAVEVISTGVVTTICQWSPAFKVALSAPFSLTWVPSVAATNRNVSPSALEPSGTVRKSCPQPDTGESSSITESQKLAPYGMFAQACPP